MQGTPSLLWRATLAGVWQDTDGLKAGNSLSQSIRETLSRTAAVVSLYSPNYFASDYCVFEREAFEKLCGAEIRCETYSRLINVVIRSNDDVKRFASGDRLYANLCDAGGPLKVGSEPFRQELGKLVQALKGLLETMRKKAPKVYVSLPSAGREDDSNTFISKKTEELLQNLSQWGYARTTEFHPGFYRDADLEEEIRASLLSVHLVFDVSDPLTRRQIEATLRAGVPMLVWLAESARGDRAGWIAEKVPGKNREYSEDAFPDFCDRVRNFLEGLANPPVPNAKSGPAKTVFVLRHPQVDSKATASLRNRLIAKNLSVTFENKDADWDAIHGVLVYQKDATVNWFKTKLEFVANKPLVRAACPVSPPDKSQARQVADDFLFRPPSAFDPKDPRILLEGDQHDDLRPFIDAVLCSAQANGGNLQPQPGWAAAGGAAAGALPEI
jgi:hypothetical protein